MIYRSSSILQFNRLLYRDWRIGPFKSGLCVDSCALLNLLSSAIVFVFSVKSLNRFLDKLYIVYVISSSLVAVVVMIVFASTDVANY